MFRDLHLQHSGVTSHGLHSLECLRGTFTMSDTQLDRLAELLGVEGPDRASIKSGLITKLRDDHNWRNSLSRAGLEAPPPCVWNMLLRRRCGNEKLKKAENVGGAVRPLGISLLLLLHLLLLTIRETLCHVFMSNE